MMAGVEERHWDTLPAAALVTIFRKLGVEDRFKGGPLVCRSWNDASRNLRCWESMLPEGDCPELRFIKNNEELVTSPTGYLSILGIRAFVERSGDGATTLYFSHRYPFTVIDEDTLFFIAERCPKLKHLSLRGCELNSEDGFLKLVRSCQELELFDLSDACELSSAVLQEMGRRWPDLRGFRRNCFFHGPVEVSAIATCFPQLQLLNLSSTKLSIPDVSTIRKSFPCLQFLDVTKSNLYPVEKLKYIGHLIPEILSGYDERDEDQFYEDYYDDRDEDEEDLLDIASLRLEYLPSSSS